MRKRNALNPWLVHELLGIPIGEIALAIAEGHISAITMHDGIAIKNIKDFSLPENGYDWIYEELLDVHENVRKDQCDYLVTKEKWNLVGISKSETINYFNINAIEAEKAVFVFEYDQYKADELMMYINLYQEKHPEASKTQIATSLSEGFPLFDNEGTKYFLEKLQGKKPETIRGYLAKIMPPGKPGRPPLKQDK